MTPTTCVCDTQWFSLSPRRKKNICAPQCLSPSWHHSYHKTIIIVDFHKIWNPLQYFLWWCPFLFCYSFLCTTYSPLCRGPLKTTMNNYTAMLWREKYSVRIFNKLNFCPPEIYSKYTHLCERENVVYDQNILEILILEVSSLQNSQDFFSCFYFFWSKTRKQWEGVTQKPRETQRYWWHLFMTIIFRWV